MLAAFAVLIALPGSASAHKIVGRDGMVHACYRVKESQKGRSPRPRKVAWVVAGAAAQAGANGAAGSPVTDATITALTERVDALSARVEKLEALVGSVCAQVSLVTSLLPIEAFTCP